MFKVEATSGEVEIAWDAVRAAADMLLYSCLDGANVPGVGGRVIWSDSGSSRGYQWPHNLMITMGKDDLVGGGGGGNETDESGSLPSGGNMSVGSNEQLNGVVPVEVSR